MNFCIYPAGAWGTAMAIHLSRAGHVVTLVPFELEEAMDMGEDRENRRYFPGHPFPADLQIGMELKPALMEAEVLILACPSKFLRPVCRKVRGDFELARQLKMIITLCKGLETGSNSLPGQILCEELPNFGHAVLSGPTFASQVAEGQLSALVLASDAEDSFTAEVQEAFSASSLRVYTSTDLSGVELGGCLKNVYAIASGICDGLGLRDNSKAALITRAMHELVRVGTALGGRPSTFYGLTGLGDLILTCNGHESRNRTFGELFAKGTPVRVLLEERKMTVEGYHTASCFYQICLQKDIEAPILTEIYRILFEGKTAADAMNSLMQRDLKAETA